VSYLNGIPQYATVVSAGGGYIPIHIDYTILAQLFVVIAKDGGKKILYTFPPNETNLSLMARRHRRESSLSWETGTKFMNVVKS